MPWHMHAGLQAGEWWPQLMPQTLELHKLAWAIDGVPDLHCKAAISAQRSTQLAATAHAAMHASRIKGLRHQPLASTADRCTPLSTDRRLSDQLGRALSPSHGHGLAGAESEQPAAVSVPDVPATTEALLKALQKVQRKDERDIFRHPVTEAQVGRGQGQGCRMWVACS